MNNNNGDNDETEFHVNLDKVPLSLKNTVFGFKSYVNDTIENEKINDLKEINEQELNQLYESLDINEKSFIESISNIDYYRKDALNLYGVNEMNTKDIFEYFNGYFPVSLEWISDSSCNIVWKDTYLPALAILELTTPFVNENLDNNEKIDDNNNISEEEKFEIDEINESKKVINLPVGKWRVGALTKKGNLLYMRFAKLSDKKIKGAESRSEYYRKYGNPNYGNMKGYISNSKRIKLKNDFIKKYVNYDLEDASDNSNFETWGTKSNKEIMSRIKMTTDLNDDNNNNNNNDDDNKKKSKSEPRMRMYIDDYSNKRKRDDLDEDDDDDDDFRGDEKSSRSPKIIRKPIDARSYLNIKNKTSQQSRSENFDLREKLKNRNKR